MKLESNISPKVNFKLHKMFLLYIYIEVLFSLLPYTFSVHKIFNMFHPILINRICYWKKENPFCKMIMRLPSITIIIIF